MYPQMAIHHQSQTAQASISFDNLCTYCSGLAKRSNELNLPFNYKLIEDCYNCLLVQKNKQFHNKETSFMHRLTQRSDKLKHVLTKCKLNRETDIPTSLSDEAISWHNERKKSLNIDERLLQTSNINKYEIDQIYNFYDDTNELFKYKVLELYTDTDEISETRPGYCVIQLINNKHTPTASWEYDSEGKHYWYDNIGWWHGYYSKEEYDGFWYNNRPNTDAKIKWHIEQQERINNKEKI